MFRVLGNRLRRPPCPLCVSRGNVKEDVAVDQNTTGITEPLRQVDQSPHLFTSPARMIFASGKLHEFVRAHMYICCTAKHFDRPTASGSGSNYACRLADTGVIARELEFHLGMGQETETGANFLGYRYLSLGLRARFEACYS